MEKPPGNATSTVVAVLHGVAQGVPLFGALLVAELLTLSSGHASALGSPWATILAVYFVAGAASGTLAGIAAWLAARVLRVQPARFSLILLVYVCGVLFAIRATPLHQLRAFSLLPVAIVACGILAVVLGAWWTRRVRNSGSTSAPVVRAGGFVCAGLACVITVAAVPVWNYRMAVADPAPSDAPNVVFVLVDALRADRLSSFGYPRPTSPFIDRLASSGTAFTNAYSHGNRTIIAMPSLFTSIYPSYTRAIESGEWATPLPDSQTTIAEIFRDAGYATFAMMSNPFLKRPFALTQGFDHVEEFNQGRFHLSLYRAIVGCGLLAKPQYADGMTASATEVTDAALRWLGRVPSQAPFFCYTHYMDVHHPYLPPRAFEEMFSSSERLAQIDPAALYARTVELVNEKRPYPLDEDELARLSDLYDGCIRYVDSEIARLVDAARRTNGRPTIVVVTSDHGDEFQEHGCLYHNNVVIEELIRVPLVIWRSDRTSGRRVDELVRHVDVLPTLAEFIGAPLPSRAVGRSLGPLMNGEGAGIAPPGSVAEGDYCSAVVEPGWKLMRVDTTGTDALFDLSRDPATKRNVAALQNERFHRMRGFLDLYFTGVPAVEPGQRVSDGATLRQLRTLGYIH